MERFVIASTNKSAGKTSVLVGLMGESKSCGYMKPLGDRLVYHQKRLWDHDAYLIRKVYGLDQEVERMTIGFDHNKLRYMYDARALSKKLSEMAKEAEKGRDRLFVEAPEDLSRGTSVGLDFASLTKNLKAKLILLVDGIDYDILDDLLFYRKYVDSKKIPLAGVIINKVREMRDFKETHLEEIRSEGIPVLGVIPAVDSLTHFHINYLSDYLFCKVLTGEENLDRKAKNIFIGAMAATSAMKNPSFKRENTLVVTSGDRGDMILAAIENDAPAVVLTNDIMPHKNIVARAREKGTPLLLTSYDTFRTAMQLEYAESLLTPEDKDKIRRMKKLVKEHVDTREILG